jgi:pyruvate dehydrogenase E2 component (dihydrolipoamide acetyltransferase)
MTDLEELAIQGDEMSNPLLSARQGDVIPLSQEQRQAGEHLIQSVSRVPQFYVAMEINASAMLAKINQWAEDTRPSFTAFLLQGVGKTLEAFPVFNATFVEEERIKLHPQVHLAVAVDTPAGLQLPVVLDVTRQTILTIDQELKRLTQKAQKGELSPHDKEGGTVTVFNLGMFGVAEFSTIITPPQIAALAAGAIAYRLVMTGNRIINLPFFMMRLLADQRVIDAIMAAKFLRKLKEILEE